MAARDIRQRYRSIDDRDMIMPILYIALFVFIAAYIDWEHLEDNDYIEDHSSRMAMRILFIIAASSNVVEVLGMAMFFAGSFDKVLNKMRTLPMYRLGKTASWDKFWRERIFTYKLITWALFGSSIIILWYSDLIYSELEQKFNILLKIVWKKFGG